MEKSVYKHKMKNSRTYKSTRNIVFGVGNQIVIIILGFISRSIFLTFLNESYLGINSLFAEMISILSLADLGINTVMVYSFYKPLAEHNEKKILSLLSFYKIIYRLIATVIILLGIIILPFLNHIVKLDDTVSFIHIYYLLFLLKTAGSYLCVYRVSILNADQNNYIVNYITIGVNIVTTLLQIIVLILARSYLLFLVLNVISVWTINFLCVKKAEQMYPFIKSKETFPLDEKKELLQNIRSGFLYKFSSVLLNSTDNIIISTMLGTVTVGYYSNYGLVINKISALINIGFSAMTSSVGNLMVTESTKKKYQIFTIIQLFSFFLGGIACICIYILIDDFIFLWIGQKYILGKDVLSACIINFYLSIVLQPLWIYREATGLYQKTKNIMICTAVLNIILSLLMVQWVGLAGIIFASAISRLLTYCWYEPILLFNQYFNQNVSEYFLKHLYNIVIIISAITIYTHFIDMFTCMNWTDFVCKCMLVFIGTFLSFLLAYCWRKDLKNAINYLLRYLKVST